jgi:hypothetical protein
MVPEYDDLLPLVLSKLATIGYQLSENDDFVAKFENGSDWYIIFEGDPYVRPAFNLVVNMQDKSGNIIHSFNVRLLMEVFSVKEKPSLSAQLDFIIKYHNEIFSQMAQYKGRYEALNQKF